MRAYLACYEHGTRARYVAGCRCDACRGANRTRYRERMAAMREAATSVAPSAPPIEGTMRRGGRDVRVLRCPGANGRACVVEGGAWLRGATVCGRCVERVTVWDGAVPVARARAHMMRLRRAGVGYRAVSAACDVATSVLGRVLAGEGTIRASTERRILAVDAGARADHAVLCGPAVVRANRLLAAMRERGFTLRHLAILLGYRTGATSPQLGHRARMTAATRARIERLWSRIERGDVLPMRAHVDAVTERAWLRSLLDAGVPARWLSQRIGVTVSRQSTAGDAPMRPATREAVRRFRAELDELRRDGLGLPDDWQAPTSVGQTIAMLEWSAGGFHAAGRRRG